MKKRFFSFIVLVSMLLFGACRRELAVQEENGIQPELNFETVVEQKELETEEEAIQAEKENENEQERFPRAGYTVNNSNIYEVNEVIDIDDISYSQITYQVQKNLPDSISKEEVTFWDEDENDNGLLLDGKSYIFVNISIENTGQGLVELYISGGYIGVLDDQNRIMDSSNELRYRSNYDSDNEYQKDYYLIKMAPGEKATFELGYIVNDQLINSENLYFIINQYGFGPGYDQLKAFKLK